MLTLILVLIGGAIGSVGRYACSYWVVTRFRQTFPWGTLVVNLGGSFLVGVAAGIVHRLGPGYWADLIKPLVIVGVCGGFTTFSAFSLETLGLFRENRCGLALANMIGSTTFSLLLVALGWYLACLSR
jgi:fluoride exporter